MKQASVSPPKQPTWRMGTSRLPQTQAEIAQSAPTPIGLAASGSAGRLLELVAETSALISSSLDLDQTLQHIVKSLAGLLNASDCGILLLDHDGRRLIGAAGFGTVDRVYREIGVGLDEVSLMGTAIAQQRPVVSVDVPNDPLSHQETYKRLRARSVIAFPLAVQSRPIGVILIAETRHYRTFTEDEVRLASAMAGMAATAIENARLHSRQQRAIWELHDGLAQTLSCMRLKAKLAKDSLSAAEPEAADLELMDIYELSLQADKAVRACMAELRCQPHASRDPFPTLAQTVQDFQRRTGLSIELLVEGTHTELSPVLESEVVRILQEALHNVEKHAGATRTIVRFHGSADKVEVSVQDNGCGFDVPVVAEASQARFGLEIIRQRAERLSGTLVIHSRVGFGTVIQAVLPVKSRSGGNQ